jgi:hypothetical protein
MSNNNSRTTLDSKKIRKLQASASVSVTGRDLYRPFLKMVVGGITPTDQGFIVALRRA